MISIASVAPTRTGTLTLALFLSVDLFAQLEVFPSQIIDSAL
jgi:hypothetical protein